ncbi:MAG: MBL fold metallo-hydrolase [Candidatus Omnitrophota bacterium]
MVKIKTFVVGPLQTNCYLVYDEDGKTGFLIDPGLFDKRITEEIKKNGIHIKNIINTHNHPDHTSGNSRFGYPVLIHADDGGTLKNGDIISDDSISFEVIYTPGHTLGSISLKMGNVIFTGDTLFKDGVGRTDLPGGSEKELVNSVKRLMEFDRSTKILPGHGPSSTIGDERKACLNW